MPTARIVRTYKARIEPVKRRVQGKNTPATIESAIATTPSGGNIWRQRKVSGFRLAMRAFQKP
jgi:hypothetical protein